MRTLKFKPQLMVYVFRCCQSSKRTSWETEAHFSRVKRSRLSVVIGRFRSILFVSVFQGSLAVAIIMIDGSEKPNRQLGFELQSSHVIENRNKVGLTCIAIECYENDWEVADEPWPYTEMFVNTACVSLIIIIMKAKNTHLKVVRSERMANCFRANSPSRSHVW